MKLSRLQVIPSLFLAAILSVPALASVPSTNSALPGTLNYVEGQAEFGDQSINAKSVGQDTLQVGQTLNTQDGKVELLLTPGVFLRAGDNTQVRMVADSLTDTALDVTQGHVIVEVDDIYKQNDIRIQAGNSMTTLQKPGLYSFNLNENEIRVFDGKAVVQENDKHVTVKGGHEVAIAPNPENKKLKAKSFDKKEYESNDLYKWSSLRSDYLAEANIGEAQSYASNGWYGPSWWGGWAGTGWYGPGWGGWCWNPYFSAYTFLPMNGIFYSPFGWGFYSPAYVYRAPFFPGHDIHHFNDRDIHAWSAGSHYALNPGYAHGVYRGPGAARAPFHAGSVGVARGGFSGVRGGGFHGGGFHAGGGEDFMVVAGFTAAVVLQAVMVGNS